MCCCLVVDSASTNVLLSGNLLREDTAEHHKDVVPGGVMSVGCVAGEGAGERECVGVWLGQGTALGVTGEEDSRHI